MFNKHRVMIIGLKSMIFVAPVKVEVMIFLFMSMI